MARFLCWHSQEQAFGGLDPETAKHHRLAVEQTNVVGFCHNNCHPFGVTMIAFLRVMDWICRPAPRVFFL